MVARKSRNIFFLTHICSSRLDPQLDWVLPVLALFVVNRPRPSVTSPPPCFQSRMCARAPSFSRIHDQSQKQHTRQDSSGRSRGLYLTTLNTHKTQTSMLSAGFGPALLESERSQTHTLDRTAPLESARRNKVGKNEGCNCHD